MLLDVVSVWGSLFVGVSGIPICGVAVGLVLIGVWFVGVSNIVVVLVSRSNESLLYDDTNLWRVFAAWTTSCSVASVVRSFHEFIKTLFASSSFDSNLGVSIRLSRSEMSYSGCLNSFFGRFCALSMDSLCIVLP